MRSLCAEIIVLFFVGTVFTASVLAKDSVAPVEQIHAARPARFNYYNNAGIGFYTPSQMFEEFPLQVIPMPDSDSEFVWHSLGPRQGYWRAASGYYYPWCRPAAPLTASLPFERPTFKFSSGVLEIATPPIRRVIDDLRDYLVLQQTQEIIDTLNLKHLNLVLDDIENQFKQVDVANTGEGAKESTKEPAIRQRLKSLCQEMVIQLHRYR